VMARLQAEGSRVEADLAADKLGAKIRRAQLEKIPYMVVVGEKDMAARMVSPRTREGVQQPAQPLDDFARRLASEAKVPEPGKIPDVAEDPPAPAGITIG
jgi:threonyl-tRNA synthetase